jgi:2-deoxy-D-gluconate 3-dehydrogenase
MSPSPFSLQGKSAILTGATRGIGKGIALGLAQAGADIILLQVFEPSHFDR